MGWPTFDVVQDEGENGGHVPSKPHTETSKTGNIVKKGKVQTNYSSNGFTETYNRPATF